MSLSCLVVMTVLVAAAPPSVSGEGAKSSAAEVLVAARASRAVWNKAFPSPQSGFNYHCVNLSGWLIRILTSVIITFRHCGSWINLAGTY